MIQSDSIPPTVAVTGAGSEIGGSLSIALAKKGVEVVMIDRSQRHMIAIYDAICAANGPEPLMVEFDLAKAEESQFDILGQSLETEVPALNGLVHCALWGAPLTPIALSNLTTWNKVLDQQLARPVFLTRSLYPLLNQATKSAVIFTTLNCGEQGRAYWGAVGAAFAGVINVVQTLNSEWSDSGLHADTIDCSAVKTAVRKKFYPAAPEDDLMDASDPGFISRFLDILDI